VKDRVELLSSARAGDVTDVLCDAFHDYPVMRYVIGACDQYDARLHRLIHFFVMNRMLRDEPVIGTMDDGNVSGVAMVTPHGPRATVSELLDQREALWKMLGTGARMRYEGLGEIWSGFDVGAPNLHLGMIGVRTSHAGRGLGRILLDAVHTMSARDPVSTGVTLTTEDPDNVSLYQHFGYRIVGTADINGEFETWGFFRPDRTDAG